MVKELLQLKGKAQIEGDIVTGKTANGTNGIVQWHLQNGCKYFRTSNRYAVACK